MLKPLPAPTHLACLDFWGASYRTPSFDLPEKAIPFGQMERLAASAFPPSLVVSLPGPPSRSPCLLPAPRAAKSAGPLGAAPAPAMSLGFESLKETFTVDVARAEGRPLDVPLVAPFTIATSRLEAVSNVAVRVELRGGSVGWGEAPVLPHVTVEDQPAALEGAAEACRALVRAPPATLGAALAEVGQVLPGHRFASARAGVEMALIDAVANSIRVPLWRLFGGATNSVTTDITIPIVSPEAAAGLAASYQKKGFTTLKLKVGKDLNADIEVLRAVRVAHPTCSFILDANEGYTAPEAIGVLEKLHEMGLAPVLFEQPVHRDDWKGLCHVSHVAKGRYGVSVAADESCRSLEDAYKIIEGNLAHVINIKLAKLGVLGSLEVIEAARRAGLGLMIGGMVETRLAMGFSGHVAAGMGCFSFIDLDTPLLLSEDPVFGGYEEKLTRGPEKFGHLLVRFNSIDVHLSNERSFNSRQDISEGISVGLCCVLFHSFLHV